MISAQLADGRILEFPDGTDPAVIQKAVKQILASGQGAEQKQVPSSIAPIPEPEPQQFGPPVSTISPGLAPRPISSEADVQKAEQQLQTVKGLTQSTADIFKGYPLAEAGMSMASGMGAMPIAGLAGLGSLILNKGDIKAADLTRQKVQEAGTYRPATAAGQRVTETLGMPGQLIKKGIDVVADPIAEAGYPGTATALATAAETLPMLAGAKKPIKSLAKSLNEASKTPLTDLAKIATESKKTVVKAINQAIKPAASKKKTAAAVKSYDNKALTAVEKIVDNKENLSFLDESGSPVSRLPESLDDFQNAISQTKKQVFNEYDALAKKADNFTEVRPLKYPLKEGETVIFKNGKATGIGKKEPLRVSGQDAVEGLREILNSEPLKATSPTTLKYAQNRIERFSGKNFSATEAQEAIQILNKSLDAFYKDPSVATYGKSLVDSVLANNLRKGLDNLVEKATGKDYQRLKNEYKAFKTIEDDVAKAANKTRNKATGVILPDFSDIVAGHQIVSGLAALNPSTVAGGATIKALSSVRKILKDPNRKIKSMFEAIEKNKLKAARLEEK